MIFGKDAMALIGTDIEHAVDLVEAGEVIGIPTETVYGLAGNAFNTGAVTRIFKIKKRPSFDPLIVHTDSLSKIRGFVKAIPESALQLAEYFWPGPLTLLLPKKNTIPDLVTSGLPDVAVRIPDHATTLALLQRLTFPLAAPSANPFGYVSPTSAQHVNDQLGDKIPYILNGGGSTVGIESTIIGYEGDQPIVYRLGGLPLKKIEEIVGEVKVMAHSSSDPTTPGSLKSHYAPDKKVIIGDIKQLINTYKDHRFALLSFQKYHEDIPAQNQLVLSPTGDLDEAAKNLFSGLRQLDKLPVEYIFSEFVPPKDLGLAINDRLKRAAAK